MKIINKVAFLIHEPVLYTHYASVWAEMERSDFVILLLNNFSEERRKHFLGAEEFMDKIAKLGYEWHYFDDLLRSHTKFRYVVSNHKMMGSTAKSASIKIRLVAEAKIFIKNAINLMYKIANHPKRYFISRNYSPQYTPLQVGIKQIRFMYGADIGDGWSLQSWNEIYDLFLCHGPNDEEQLSKRFKGKTVVMGYPRYDHYFSEDLDISQTIKEFGIVPTKKTILWMPTLGDNACSIPFFAEEIAGLFSDYNVIVRPHPISFRQEPEKIELLRSLCFVIDADSTRDMNKLFKAVDFVICDYGGSSFGVIYLGKKLVLLDVPDSENQFTVLNSSNQELRGFFPAIGPENAHLLRSILEDEEQWAKQEDMSSEIFNKYFADNRGSSSRKAAEILSNLESILAA